MKLATRALTLAAAGVVLAGCAGGPAARLTGHERDWAFVAASVDEPAKLGYGRPSTDDLDLMLWCAEGKHKARLTPIGPDDQTFKRMRIESGRARLDLALSQSAELGSFGLAGLDSPVLSSFRASGRLRMVLDGGRPIQMDAGSAEGRQAVSQFFDACR